MFKLAFGPKAFIIVSDPAIAKHILRSNASSYDKGILAEILEPIMGKGLIPADFETWKLRRRAIVPAFHQQWMTRMVRVFTDCTAVMHGRLLAAAAAGEVVNMESTFCSLALVRGARGEGSGPWGGGRRGVGGSGEIGRASCRERVSSPV